MIYFDNAATTPVDPSLNRVIAEYNSELFYNPSARYSPALQSANAIGTAKNRIADVLGVDARELHFTSCATESNNTVLRGVCRYPSRCRIVTTCGEHASVRNTVEDLAQKGAKVLYAPLYHDGRVNTGALLDLLDDETTIVSLIHVSNETGAINDVSAIAEEIKDISPKTLVHVDGVQGFAKYKISFRHIDFYTASAHKINAPKGVGLLYVKKGVHLPPLVTGGAQEGGLRAGTENLSGIVAFGIAAQSYRDAFDADKLFRLKNTLCDGLAQIPGFFVNAPMSDRVSPHVLSCGFHGVRGETLMHALCERGIVIGMGSACSSHAVGNDTLAAMGYDKDRIMQSVRISFGLHNTEEEVTALIGQCTQIVQELRG